MSKLRLTPLALPLVLATGMLGAKPAAMTAEELAEHVEKRYRSLKSLSADFVKVVASEIFETENTVKGKMIFRNLDKFKIETKDQTVVSNGEFIWTYSAENQQVIRNLADRSENLFKPHQYLSDFRSEYVPQLEGEEKIGRSRCFKLLLSPEEKDLFIRKMTIWVDKESLLARRIEYTDCNDNDVTLTFQHIKTNRKIKDSEFVFKAPPGVEEVDLTE
jgi:outer membrane lipoprotein-sorting protein